jgi:hypothetical protein
MGILLDFQFVVVLNLLVLALWPATSPYMGARTAEAGRWSGMSPLYIILAILTALAFILDIVFLAGGHAH